MECELTCRYCGHTWTKHLYIRDKIKCPKCEDTNIKIKEVDKTSKDAFGYNKGQELDDSFLRNK